VLQKKIFHLKMYFIWTIKCFEFEFEFEFELDHNPVVLLWSADIASTVQIVAGPIQPLYLMLTGLKVELLSVA
jgi:hypothetical protein